MSSKKSLPRVPDVHDPQSKTPVTKWVGPGTLFIPMHFAAGAVNKLTGETAGIPEYKVSSVRVDPLGPETEESVLTTPDAGGRSVRKRGPGDG